MFERVTLEDGTTRIACANAAIALAHVLGRSTSRPVECLRLGPDGLMCGEVASLGAAAQPIGIKGDPLVESCAVARDS